MKLNKLLAGVILCVAGYASAATSSTAVCTGTAGDASVTAASGGFAVNNFTMKCSANTQVAWIEDSTAAAVCANSKKGKNNFGGTTAGGGVSAKGACTLSSGACAAQAAVLATGC